MFIQTEQIFTDDAGKESVSSVIIQTGSIACVYPSNNGTSTSIVLFNNGSNILINEPFYYFLEKLEVLSSAGVSLGWNLCKNFLPDNNDEYLVTVDNPKYDPSLFVDIDEYVNGRWKNFGSKVVAWTNFPGPAKI